MLRFGRIVTDKTHEFFHDGSSNAKDIPVENPKAQQNASPKSLLDKQIALFEKGLDLAGAKLDQELVEMGVATKKQVEEMPLVKKKVLYKNTFLKNMMKHASGDILGIVPVQTAVKIKSDGNAVVGVVVVLSDKTIQVAKDIAAQRATFVKGAPRDLKTLKPATYEEKLGNLGARLIYDQDGVPAIVSYGIAAFVSDGDDDYINSTLATDAQRHAADNAEAQISEMVNGYMSAENIRITGQDVEKYVEREMTPNSMTNEKKVENLVKITRAQAKASSKMKLPGISPLDSGRFKLPSGQVMYYSVRAWKYSTLASVKRFNDNAQKIRPGGKPAAPAQPGNGHNFDGRKFNTLEDF